MRRGLSLSAILFVAAGLCQSAGAKPISIGAFAGLNVPIAQEDAGNGALFGAKLRVALGSIFALEPTLTFLQQGDATAQIGDEEFELDGGKSTALGLNFIVGSSGPPSGVSFYGVLGLASHALKQEGTEDQNRLALSFGPGAEIGVGDKLALDIQTRLHMISLDGGGARKNLGFSGGLVYYLSN
jgi:hypothetical protein